MMDPKVIETAALARLWAEERASRLDDSDPDDLSCYCAIASVKLSMLLTAAAIKHRIAMADDLCGSHVFVLVDGWIVDVTATQFGVDDKIFVKHERAPDLRWFHKITRTFGDVHSLVLWQLKKGWPKDQMISKPEWAAA